MPLLFSRRGNSGFFHLVSQNPLTDAQGLRRLCLHPVMGPECGNHHLFFQAGQALLQQTGIRSFFKDLRRQVIPSNHIAPYQGAQALDQMFQFPDIPPPAPENTVSRVGQQFAVFSVCCQTYHCRGLSGIHTQFHSYGSPGLKQPAQLKQKKGTDTRTVQIQYEYLSGYEQTVTWLVEDVFHGRSCREFSVIVYDTMVFHQFK